MRVQRELRVRQPWSTSTRSTPCPPGDPTQLPSRGRAGCPRRGSGRLATQRAVGANEHQRSEEQAGGTGFVDSHHLEREISSGWSRNAASASSYRVRAPSVSPRRVGLKMPKDIEFAEELIRRGANLFPLARRPEPTSRDPAGQTVVWRFGNGTMCRPHAG